MAKLIRPAKWFKKARAGNGDEVLKRLEDYLNGNFDEPVKILCGFWKDQQDAISYQELREAVINGKLDESTWKAWSHDYSVLVSSKLKNIWEEAAKAGAKGQPIMDGLNFSFNPQSAGIMKWITERGADFVTNSTNEQKKAIQYLLAKNVREKHTVDELAKVIRPCIGLTKQQAAANQRYYDNIVETLKKEHPKMKRESIQKKAREAAAKYAERQHRGRAMTIAQTEMAFAYNWGAHEGIKQAQRQGYIGTVVKRWSTAGGDRVYKVCEALEGMEVGMDSKFNINLKAVFSDQHMLPPAHPRCMCAIEYVEAEPAKLLRLPQRSNVPDMYSGNKHTAPKYLGSIETVSETVVKSVLKKYEAKIADSDIENAVVITSSGLIWQCYGDKKHAYPNIDLGDELKGASVTHNHPVNSSNEYTFSTDDLDLFMEYDLKILRGIDELYVYELNRNAADIEDLQLFIEDLNEYNWRHQQVNDIAKKLGIGYRRKKR